MTDKRPIEHTGIVEEADGGRVKVRILSASACAACHAKGACTAADLQEKYIDAIGEGTYSPGDKVLLIGETKLGLKAAWWAYMLPLLIMLVTLIITHTFTQNEPLSGLMSLGILIPYYLAIKLFYSKFLKTFSFTIKPSTE